MRSAVIEFSTDGSTWNNVSGVANSVESDGSERTTGEVYTADGDTAITGIGKLQPAEVDMNIVYSEATTEGYILLEGLHKNATACKVRWAPKGATTGNYRYTSATGHITKCPPPSGDVESGDPILVTVTHRSPGITAAAIS